MEIQTLALLTSICIPFMLIFPVFWRWKLNLIFAAGTSTIAVLSSYGFFRVGMTIGLSVPMYALFGSPIISALFWSGILIFTLLFRDPERHPPDVAGSIISPADGTVIYIRPVVKGQIPISVKKKKAIEIRELIHPNNPIHEGMLVGIEMLLSDVHVNRAPISGHIVHQEYIPGKFKSLRDLESRAENERLYTVFQNAGIMIGVIQIASRLVRRILSYVQQEDAITRGDRMGMIQFSSQVDLLIDKNIDAEIMIREGDHVKAGETIIARYTAKS